MNIKQSLIIGNLLLNVCCLNYAADTTDNNTLPSDYNLPANPNLLPPPPVAPNETYPEVGTDSSTSSYPDNNSAMDTVQTQSIGTSWDHHPRSNPLQLDKIPTPEPNNELVEPTE